MDELRKRKELTGLFTFFAANYPQYELMIDNELAMQKGVSIGKALENLDILIGSTYEQGFIRFGQFFKVYTQAAPEYRRLPSDILNSTSRTTKKRWSLFGLHEAEEDAGPERDHPLQPVQFVGNPRWSGGWLHQR